MQIVIQEDGKVTIAGEPTEVHLQSGNKNNQLQLVVTNQALLSLPETGGMGGLGIIASLSGIVSFAIYSFLRRKREINE